MWEVMQELKQDRKSRYTRMVLRDSLIELMKEKPITKITIKEICENADINRTTFYAHYKDQYDLLQKIEEETIAWFEDMLNKYDYKRSNNEIAEMIELILTHVADNSNSIQVLLSENGNLYFQKKIFSHFINKELVVKHFAGKINDEKSFEYYMIFIMNGIFGLIQHWLKNKMAISVSEMSKILLKIVAIAVFGMKLLIRGGAAIMSLLFQLFTAFLWKIKFGKAGFFKMQAQQLRLLKINCLSF
jgi:AcrR family transcriptional regulator